MLQLLKETVSSRHAERLETIVIWLIVVEIGKPHILQPLNLRQEEALCSRIALGLGIITILVDLFS